MNALFWRILSPLLLLAVLATLSSADEGPPPTKSKSFLKAVPRAWTSFEPATAKRGHTITWRLTVELAPGWHTYPLKQVDPKAQDNVTTITFPANGDVVF